MAISATLKAVQSRDVLEGAQIGTAVAVADGAVSDPLDQGFYRLIATGACRVRIGPDLTDATGGEYWPEGHFETLFIREGHVIAVDALA